MGFLEALGRSQAVTGTLGAVENLNVSRRNQAIKEAQFGMQQEQLTMQKAEEGRRQQEFDFKLQKAKREEEWLNSAYNITTDPRFQEMDEAGQKAALAFGEGQGLWNAEGIGTIKSARRAGELIESNEGLFETSAQSVVNKRKAAYDNTLKLLTEEKEKPSPNEKKVAALEAQAPLLAERYRLALDGKIKGVEAIKQRNEAESAYGKWAADSGLDPTRPETQQAYARHRQSLLSPPTPDVITEEDARTKVAELEESILKIQQFGAVDPIMAEVYGITTVDPTAAIEEYRSLQKFYKSKIKGGEVAKERKGERGEVLKAFRMDPQSKGLVLGKKWTAQGYVVYKRDKKGKLIEHSYYGFTR